MATRGLDIGGVGVARPGAFAAAVTFSPGDTVYTDIDYNNETGSTQTRDVALLLGSYNPDTGTFTSTWGILLGEDVDFSTGTGLTYTSPTWTIPNIEAGTYDVVAALGTYDPDTGNFTTQAPENMVKIDYLTIGKPAAPKRVEVTGFEVYSA